MNDFSDEFLTLVLAHDTNRLILERLPALDVSQAWLVAGCLFGPVWNALSGQPPGANIRDYDIFYWDPDTSWEAEDAVIRRADDLFADLGIVHQVRNQARVPLWFEQRFGQPWPATSRSADSIARFVVSGTCVGVRPRGHDSFDLVAPKGFDDLFSGILRLNPDNPTPHLFRTKCKSYLCRWPWLTMAEDNVTR